MTIQEILWAKEGEGIEFKEAKNSYSLDELEKYSCAIANSGGGHIVLGVSDRRPREIVGTKAFPQPEETCRILSARLRIKIDFTLYEQQEGRVLVFSISSRPLGLPIYANGIAYSREGDKLVKMMPDTFRSIYEESAKDF